MRRDGPPATLLTPVGTVEPGDLERLTDEEAIARAQSDPSENDACVALLYQRHGNKVTAWCRRLCKDQDLAEDAAQEVFIKVQQRLGSFQGGSRFTTWLFVLARNSTLDFLATRRNQGAGEALDELPNEPANPDSSVEDTLANQDLRDRMRHAIQTVLEPDEARVVVLHCIYGLTLPAVTSLMELDNRSGAKALFVAAKRRLKAHFAKELSELEFEHRRAPDDRSAIQ